MKVKNGTWSHIVTVIGQEILNQEYQCNWFYHVFAWSLNLCGDLRLRRDLHCSAVRGYVGSSERNSFHLLLAD